MLSVFLWSESWTSYVESTGTSESNWFLNLVEKQPWEHMTHSMISWGSTNLMWPIPKKMFISSVKKCNMFSKFWMAPSALNFDKFSLETNMFFIWPGSGFLLFVCGISQKKSVDLHFLGMTSSLWRKPLRKVLHKRTFCAPDQGQMLDMWGDIQQMSTLMWWCHSYAKM